MAEAIVTGGYWQGRLAVNAARAIFHQLEELEKAGTIDNFRIAVGELDGFREGLFFTDSDFYKWLEAAARIQRTHPTAELARLLDDSIALVGRAQAADGYLHTYNQIHFRGRRWINLQIEHELYCFGHLIEAGVSRLEATGHTDLLNIARRAADCLVRDFAGKDPAFTPGHEGIELALLRLYGITQAEAYRRLAQQFVEQRGRIKPFGPTMLRQLASVARRIIVIEGKRRRFYRAHPDHRRYHDEPWNFARKPRGIGWRWLRNMLDGRYLQQHAPVRDSHSPEGHAVCFGYFQTGTAMLLQANGDQSLLPALQAAWEHMVTRRMYVTGGLGSLPGIEGFGADYELDPEYAYTESCAALANIFWNWEMAKITGEAKYSDLLEWQLYNAAAVGMGQTGTTYFYNNPLLCRGGVVRRPWFKVPCCPSNLSRVFANLAQYIATEDGRSVWLHQYVTSSVTTRHVRLEISADLPWQGRVKIKVEPVNDASHEFTLHLRIPSWALSSDPLCVMVNGASIATSRLSTVAVSPEPTAHGYDPRQAIFVQITRTWSAGDCVEVDFPMPVLIRRAHPKVAGHTGKAAVTRGPLVYASESTDNPEVDVADVRLLAGSFEPVWDDTLLGGIFKIQARAEIGQPVVLIPYHLWGNRGASQMRVWVNLAPQA